MDAPADPISDVQDAIIARLEAAFNMKSAKRALRQVRPMQISPEKGADMLEQLVSPSANLLFLEARPTKQTDTIDLVWGVYAVSGRAALDARTRGDAREMGSYGIASRAFRALSEFVPGVDGASALTFQGFQNIATEKLSRKKMSVVALTVSGQVTVGFDDENADIADFLHYHSDWKVAPSDEEAPENLPLVDPDLTNDVILTGASDAS